MKMYNLIDLFAGCGGLSLGLEKHGFQPCFVNELNNDAMSTYLLNRDYILGGVKFSELNDLHINDVNDIKGKRLLKLKSDLKNIGIYTGENGNLDLLVGGPPCQGYSGIGIRRSYSVDKENIPSNQLYKKMTYLIGELRPKIFLFENVRGILTSRWVDTSSKGEIWVDVFKEFQKISKEYNYELRWQLVHAKSYGVPQNRPRVLMVGIRSDIVKSNNLSKNIDYNIELKSGSAINSGYLPHFGLYNVPDIIDLFSDLVDPKISDILISQNFPNEFSTFKYQTNPTSQAQQILRNIKSKKGDLITEQDYSRHKKLVVDKFIYMLKNNGEIPHNLKTKKFAQRLLPPKWGNQGPTITATSLPDDYVHYLQPRSLTVREWARLQTFPDWYQFSGKRTTGGLRRAGNPREGIFDREAPKYTQIGNAVPVWLAEAIGNHFKKILDTNA